jgi:hypothetical protein
MEQNILAKKKKGNEKEKENWARKTIFIKT